MQIAPPNIYQFTIMRPGTQLTSAVSSFDFSSYPGEHVDPFRYPERCQNVTLKDRPNCAVEYLLLDNEARYSDDVCSFEFRFFVVSGEHVDPFRYPECCQNVTLKDHANCAVENAVVVVFKAVNKVRRDV